jgi:hypothetical protein
MSGAVKVITPLCLLVHWKKYNMYHQHVPPTCTTTNMYHHQHVQQPTCTTTNMYHNQHMHSTRTWSWRNRGPSWPRDETMLWDCPAVPPAQRSRGSWWWRPPHANLILTSCLQTVKFLADWEVGGE